VLPVEEVRSASTELLTSESLKELKQLIQTTHEEQESIKSDLEAAREEKRTAYDKWFSWDDGVLLKRIFKKKFAERKTALDTAEAKVVELEEQLRMTRIATQIDIDKQQAELYFRMRDAFARLSECAAIWDIKSHKGTDKFHQRTTADLHISRARTRFVLDGCDLITWNQQVPHLENVKGGDMFLYPGFILYRAARSAFSVIGYHDVHCMVSVPEFQEPEAVPADSKVVGQTWAKANKDGSRDKRFVNNYAIPIALYGWWSLKSETGLWEEFFSPTPNVSRRS
jgi:hypothetical protein